MMDSAIRDFLCVLGHIFLQNGKFGRARKILAALHAAFPEDAEVTRSYLYSSLMAGLPEDALALSEDYLAGAKLSDRDRAMGTLLRGRVLWAAGRKDEARKLLEHFFLPSS